MGMVEQLLPAVPAWQAQQGIHPHQKTERRIGQFMTQLDQGIDGVRGLVPSQLPLIYHKVVVLCRRQFDHGETLFAGAERIGAVGRDMVRDQPHFGQPESIARLDGRA